MEEDGGRRKMSIIAGKEYKKSKKQVTEEEIGEAWKEQKPAQDRKKKKPEQLKI